MRRPILSRSNWRIQWMNAWQDFQRCGLLPLPPGITADPSAAFKLFAMIQIMNNYSESLSPAINAGAGVTLTSAQWYVGIVNITAASGAFNITLPSTAAQMSAMNQNVIPLDGSYAEPFSIMNNGSGQTGTLVAGDSSTTITGNNTMATNTRRLFVITVNATAAGSQPTITYQNLGTMGL